ncbi:MAG: O-phospho-L-seryl-tRNA:Cys-tRNA synthase [bacterium]|nr:O-phospho-L-seryl-tRNA:Cys-tRNA synthase [bacterium]
MSLIRTREESYINLNPLQTGGRTNAEVRLTAASFVDGYSVCDYCKGVLHLIEKPSICELTKDLAEFLGMDEARLTLGCREGKFAVMHALLSVQGAIVVDSNRHYSTYVAVERANGKIYEVENTGYPEYEIRPEAYRWVFEQVLEETKKPPELALLTHVDGDYGNLVDAYEVGKICQEYGVPFLLNAAYTAGRMEVNGKKLLADFVVVSAHKGFGVPGTIGVLAISEKWRERLFRKSIKYPKKDIELLGCTARGGAAACLITALPYVKERVKHWNEEIEKARWFVEKMEALGDIEQLGIKPTKHDLIRLKTPLLNKIAQKDRKKGYFLYHELEKRGITGIKPGQTEWFKLSTYGLTWEQVKYLYGAFEEIKDGNRSATI